ncbi:3715_t:CDS:1, partial [Racocetra persica]
NKGAATGKFVDGGWDKNQDDPFDTERNSQEKANYYNNLGNSYMEVGGANDPNTAGTDIGSVNRANNNTIETHHNHDSQQNAWEKITTFEGNNHFGYQVNGDRPLERTPSSSSLPLQQRQREQDSNFKHDQGDQGSSMSRSLHAQSQPESDNVHQPAALNT